MLDNKFDEIIIGKLVARQNALGISGRELCKRCNFPKSNWSAYTKLSRSMPFDRFKTVCEVLGLDYEEVFTEAQKEFFEFHRKEGK